MAFSRKQPPALREVDLNSVIAGLRGTLLRLLVDDVEMAVSADPALGRVLADPGQVEQVIMNLVVNARDAMPAGGTINIDTRNAGPDVVLSIGDTGRGIPPEARDRIFEPFFTTKGEGQGTGLGLSIVRGIVEQSRGRIEVQSEDGRGTTFTIAFPRVEQAAALPVPPALQPMDAARGTEVVLVVDREDGIRAVVRKALFRAGYRVVEARDPEEALEFASVYSGGIDVLVAELALPSADGGWLSRRLRDHRPALRTLFLHSGLRNPAAGPGLEEGMLLEKPFTLDALTRAVRELVAAPPPRT
jgi:CheY-like chemotaxis protein/anti-sigma regulatory factor (Ser/Thr protein kinase)